MESQVNVLMIEDELDLANSAAFFLKRHGMHVTVASSLAEAEALLSAQLPDVVITDWMLNNESGLKWVKKLRSDGQRLNLPVVMVSAKNTQEDRIKALKAGVDDYIEKPFSLVELKLRLAAVVRRNQLNPEQLPVQTVENLQFDLKTHECWVDGDQIQLSARERKLLAMLVRMPGKVVDRAMVHQEIYEAPELISERSVDAVVQRLRKRLGDMGHFLESIRGVGYRLGSLSQMASD